VVQTKRSDIYREVESRFVLCIAVETKVNISAVVNKDITSSRESTAHASNRPH
jgi:hypothetical protein